MKDLISREAACGNCGLKESGFCNSCAVKTAPAADAVEVVHAKWVVKGQDVLCSHCNGESGYNAFGASSFSDHCPNRGARMDGE